MKKVLLKETAYFSVILVVLSLLMHPDLLSNPLSRFSSIVEAGNYYHPFIYTFIVYSLLLIVRITVKYILVIVTKFKKK